MTVSKSGRMGEIFSDDEGLTHHRRRFPRNFVERGLIRRYTRSRPGLVGYLFMLLVLGAVFFAGAVAPYPPFKSVGPPLQAPSLAYPMGTDDLGRDVFTAVVYGARTSLFVGASVAGIATLIGALIGTVSGYFGTWIDDGLMRITELFQVMPRFFLAVVIIAFFGPGLANLILLLGLTSWTMIARIMRAEVLSWRERDFILAARALGAGDRTVLYRHVLPNTLPSLITVVSLLTGQAILLEAALSFLGLGDPNVVSWGLLLNDAQSFMRTAWWMALFPGLAITLTVLALNLTGDGLNEAWNPRR